MIFTQLPTHSTLIFPLLYYHAGIVVYVLRVLRSYSVFYNGCRHPIQTPAFVNGIISGWMAETTINNKGQRGNNVLEHGFSYTFSSRIHFNSTGASRQGESCRKTENLFYFDGNSGLNSVKSLALFIWSSLGSRLSIKIIMYLLCTALSSQ